MQWLFEKGIFTLSKTNHKSPKGIRPSRDTQKGNASPLSGEATF